MLTVVYLTAWLLNKSCFFVTQCTKLQPNVQRDTSFILNVGKEIILRGIRSLFDHPVMLWRGWGHHFDGHAQRVSCSGGKLLYPRIVLVWTTVVVHLPWGNKNMCMICTYSKKKIQKEIVCWAQTKSSGGIRNNSPSCVTAKWREGYGIVVYYF